MVAATIWARPVSLPLPGEVTPDSRVTSPLGLMRTVAPSNAEIIGEPGMAQPSEPSSLAIPMPMKRPSARAAACSRAKSS